MAAKKKQKIVGIDGAAYLAGQLRDPVFRHHFEQRRLVQEVAMAVRKMRARAELSQAELAERVGTSQSAIARLESGADERTPQWDTLHKIAGALGLHLKMVFSSRQEKDLVQVSTRRARGEAAPSSR